MSYMILSSGEYSGYSVIAVVKRDHPLTDDESRTLKSKLAAYCNAHHEWIGKLHTVHPHHYRGEWEKQNPRPAAFNLRAELEAIGWESVTYEEMNEDYI